MGNHPHNARGYVNMYDIPNPGIALFMATLQIAKPEVISIAILPTDRDTWTSVAMYTEKEWLPQRL